MRGPIRQLFVALVVALLVALSSPAEASGTGASTGGQVAADDGLLGGAVDCAKNPIKCGTDAAGEVAGQACDTLNMDKACDKASDAGAAVVDKAGDGLSGPLNGLKDAVNGVTAALDTIASFSPSNMAEEWAKAATEGVVWALDKIGDATLSFSSPAYTAGWWAEQYAVTYGLALIVLAFMMIVVAARIGGPNGPVSGVTLARDVAGRLPWAVPAITVAPALMLEGQRLLADLARSIGRAGNAEAQSAADSFISGIAGAAPGNGAQQSFVTLLGGGLAAMCMLIPLLLLALLVLIELTFASWAGSFFGLLVPFAIVFAIWPPWRKALAGLMALLVGIWAMPFAVNLVYWSTWSAVDGMAKGNLFDTTLYVVVGTLMLAVAPVLAPMILMKLMPSYDGPSRGPSMGGQKSSSSSSSGRRERLTAQRNPEMSGGPTGGGPGAPNGAPGAGALKAAGAAPGAAPATGAGAGAGAAGGAAGAGAGAAGAAGAGAAAGGAGAATAAGGPVAGAAAAAAAIAKKMGDRAKREAGESRNRWTR